MLKKHINGGGLVEDTAHVEDSAYVGPSALVYGQATVSGQALVYGQATVSGQAAVSGDARVSGEATLSGQATVSGKATVYGIMRSDGHCFVYVPCSDGKLRVIAACRYFTMREARKHWKETRGGTALGEETFAILKALAALQKVQP